MALNSLKKIIIYRSNYSGMKETDILYEKYFIRNLEKLNEKELKQLKDVFNLYSDKEIFKILTNKLNPYKKFKNLFEKINKL